MCISNKAFRSLDSVYLSLCLLQLPPLVLFVCPSICPSTQFLSGSYYVAGTRVSADLTVVNKTDIVLVFLKFTV